MQSQLVTKVLQTPKKWNSWCACSNASPSRLAPQSITALNILTHFNSLHLILILQMMKSWIIASLIVITIQIFLPNFAASLPTCCHRLECNTHTHNGLTFNWVGYYLYVNVFLYCWFYQPVSENRRIRVLHPLANIHNNTADRITAGSLQPE